MWQEKTKAKRKTTLRGGLEARAPKTLRGGADAPRSNGNGASQSLLYEDFDAAVGGASLRGSIVGDGHGRAKRGDSCFVCGDAAL